MWYCFKKIDVSFNWDNLEIEFFSQKDISDIRLATWAFQFNCTMEELDSVKVKLNLLLLAFKILKQSDLSIKYIICKNVSHLSTKYANDWKYTLASKYPKREFEELNNLDLNNIVKVYKHIEEFFKVSPRTAHAVNFLFLAYTTYYWMEAFLLLMTALETLMSPDKIGAIVPEVTTRVVCLINDKNICSKTKFSKIYKLRSDIIHGKVLVDLNFDKELPKLQQLQIIVLKAFGVLLQINFKSIYKDENSKESFYTQITMIINEATNGNKT